MYHSLCNKVDTWWPYLDGKSPRHKVYPHSTPQHKEMRINIQGLSGIWTHDPSIQRPKTKALDSAATVFTEHQKWYSIRTYKFHLKLLFSGTYGGHLTKYKEKNFCSAISFVGIDMYLQWMNIRANEVHKIAKQGKR
jgi:hypothetical protein